MATSMQELFESSKPKPRVYSEADGQQFSQAETALVDSRFDVYGPAGRQNLALIEEFFQKNRQLPVTVPNIYRAIGERKSEFKWLSKPEADWYKTAQQNPNLANELAAYLASTSGRPGALVNSDDELFVNLLLLFNELQSRRETVSPQTVQSAEDRIAHRPGPQLHRVPTPRRTEVISPAAKADDGSPFLGTDMVRDSHGWRTKTPAEQRRDAETAEAAKASITTKSTGPADEWETIAKSYLGSGGSHGRNANLQTIYDRGTNGELSWREVARTMGELKKSYQTLLSTARY